MLPPSEQIILKNVKSLDYKESIGSQRGLWINELQSKTMQSAVFLPYIRANM